MFEHIKEDLLSFEKYIARLAKYFLIATLVLIAGLVPGIIGFMLVGDLDFGKAFANAISILGTVDIPYPLKTETGQIFIAMYGLFVETVFFVAFGILIAPVVHRAFHKLHLVENEKIE